MKGSVYVLALCCLVAAADARWMLQISQLTGATPATVPGPLGTPAGSVAVAQPTAEPAMAQPMAVQPVAAAAQPTGPADTTGALDPAAAAQAAVQAATAATQPAAAGGFPADPTPAAAGGFPAIPAPAVDPTAVPAAVPAAAPAQPAAPTRPNFPGFPDVKPASGSTLGAGITVLADPPAVPVATAEAPADGVAVPVAAKRNVTGPPAPVAGTNLMVILNVAAAEQRDIYKNQGQIKQQVAALAGVDPTRVLWFNQTGNTDRTGNTVMSLVLNVRCGDPANCKRSGQALFNSTNQAALTRTLAQGGVALIPNTTQVYGVQAMGDYQGNNTLDSSFRLGGPSKLPTTLSPTAGLPTSLPTTLPTSLGLPGAGGLGGLAPGVTLTPLGADANATTGPEAQAPAPAARSSASAATASMLAAVAAAAAALVL